jgi:hypothetical protein
MPMPNPATRRINKLLLIVYDRARRKIGEPIIARIEDAAPSPTNPF